MGFEPNTHIARILIRSSGKVLNIHVNDLERSDIAEKLSSKEIKALYRHIYTDGLAPTTEYCLQDRNEHSWNIYVILVLLLTIFFLSSNIATIKPIYVRAFNVVLTPGTFVYPFTFLIVDLLNEFYGFRLARKAIFYSLMANIAITILLHCSTFLPVMDGWPFNDLYNNFVARLCGILFASTVAFSTSEILNSWVLGKIKMLTRARRLYLRIFLSTFAASVIDSYTFCFLVFYSSMATFTILKMATIQLVLKCIYAAFNVLPAYYVRYLYRKYILHTK